MPAADPADLADDAAREVIALLQEWRRATLGSILAAEEPLSSSLRTLLAEIDALLLSYQRQLTTTLTRWSREAALAGDAAVLDDAVRAGLQIQATSYFGVSEQLVRTAAEYVASQITGLMSDARARITREVRLAALGGLDTQTLVERIGRNLSDPSVFRTIATRAEVIARTEVSRVRSMAYQEQAAELDSRYPGEMRKQWVHTVSSPGASLFQARQSRPNHIRVAQRTASEPIPVGEPFDLGNGVRAMYPHDPALPASETVNCRCRMVLVAPDPVEEARDGAGGRDERG